ncbi:MFS transporter [Mycobacterium sp.]|uniref:MFS transporter n=1 Tax=Mycobacterium sp. TaxID=1785 RepID=UPI003A837C6E
MTAEPGTVVTGTRTWTPRVAVQLTVLASAAFIYVTAELFPVGALSAMTKDLGVDDFWVGTLVSSYALVAMLTTVPLVRWTAHWPRRRALLVSLACLTTSQLISALAPNLAVLVGGRVLCAVTHGLLLSVIAPMATRLVPPSHAGRATMSIYIGTSLTLVVGSPLTAALSLIGSWRMAVACITAAAAAVAVAARLLLPEMALSDDQLRHVGRRSTHHRNRELILISLITMVGVTGHFVSYTYIERIIHEVVGVNGPNVAWVLAAYGTAGMLALVVVARPLDRRPKGAIISCMAGLTTAFALLGAIAPEGRHSAVTASVMATCAIVLWGAMATPLPPMLQAAAMRHGADDPDGASGMYVTAFQVGIMGGPLAGGLLLERGGVAMMLTASAALMGAALLAMTGIRRIVDAPGQAAAGRSRA